MNDKAKALEIALSFTDLGKPTLDRCVETGIQMAAWKEQQMIEKSRIWFESVLPEILLTHEPIGIGDIFENFKKAMEGE